MEEIKKDRKKIVKVLLLIVSIVLIIALGTYAWITWQSSNNTELTMTIGQLAEVTFDTGNDISTNELAPVLDYDENKYTTFSINNKSTGYYRAYITLNITSIDSELQNEHFKYKVLKSSDNSNFEPIIEGTFKDLIVGSNNLGDVLLKAKTITYYKFLFYIDGTEENDVNMMEKSISGNLVVEASNNEPNIPNISNGLIPVTYNGDAWVKADETNANDSWYDYYNQKWANAVLVKEYDSYTETVKQSNKSVNINNEPIINKIYTSSNKNIDDSYSESVLTFTTGSTVGNLSFDYYVSSEANYDILYIYLNNELVVEENGIQSNTYIKQLAANTTYTLTMVYYKDYEGNQNEDQATISNIILPSGSSSITHTTTGEYGWIETTSSTYNLNTYNSYTISDTGIYTLNGINNVSAADSLDKYICSDMTSTKCSEVYKITAVSGNRITAVDVYGVATTGENIRDGYKNASIGSEIYEEDILAYYVWIPRYKYKVWNITKTVGVDSYDAQNIGIDIIWESGIESTGTIKCNNYNFAITDGSLSQTCSGTNGEYYTHPAFTFGDTELTGLWVGKFEISSNDSSISNGGDNTTSLSVRIKPNTISWRNNPVTNFSKVIQDISKEGNEYGLATNSDSHMIKNIEWGALAYLSHSKYGRCSDNSCAKITLNNNTSYYTGGGNYVQNVGQSTTGNITGVYDKAGGAYEYVMGNMSSTSGSYKYISASGGDNFNYSESTAKYLDTYAYGTTNSNQTAYNRGRLGDATSEVVIEQGGSYGWQGNYTYFIYSGSSYIWFIRSGYYSNGSSGGIFLYNVRNGAANTIFSTTAVLVAF